MASCELSRRVGTVEGPDEVSMVPELVIEVRTTCLGSLRDLMVGIRTVWVAPETPKDVSIGIAPFMAVFSLWHRPRI